MGATVVSVTLLVSCLHCVISQQFENIIQNNLAVQSKTFGGDDTGRLAKYAVDGDFTTCASADTDAQHPTAWWQVDLGGNNFAVYSVTIYLSTISGEGQHIQYSNIFVSASNATDGNQPICATVGVITTTPGGNVTFTCNQLQLGRYVTIRKNNQGQTLTMCEVVVIGSAVSVSTGSGNVAPMKNAIQSKTYGGDDTGKLAKYAVDGDFSSYASADTDSQHLIAWWQVDLGDSMLVVYSVTIYAAKGATDNTLVSNFNIYVSSNNSTDGSQTICGGINTSQGGNVTFNCSQPLLGRYVTIRKNNPNETLTMSEVVVIGSNFVFSYMPTTTKNPLISSTSASVSVGDSQSSSSTATYSASTPSKSTLTTTPCNTNNTDCAQSGSSNGSSNGRRNGIIIGVILGVAALIVIIFIIIFILRRTRSGHWIKDKRLFGLVRPTVVRLDDEIGLECENKFADNIQQQIAVNELAEYVDKKKQKPDAFKTEFKGLPEDFVETVTTASLQENKSKNRFQNVLPFEYNMVPVTDTDNTGRTTAVYVNASFIKSYNGVDKAYIATQGPKASTVSDFWSMIWQHNVNTIVMITPLYENGKAKCEKYWPSGVHETVQFGNFLVTMSVEDMSAEFIYREFAVQNNAQVDCEPRIVRHLHFVSWVDKSRPDLCYPLLAFRRKVNLLDNVSGPLVVHCSAGIGRTGTYIALDYLLEQAKMEGEVGIFDCIKSLRHQRMNMVQTLDQYIFVHDALVDAVATGETAIPCSTFHSDYKQLVHNDTLRKQFALLQKLKTPATDRKTSSLEQINALKNRTTYIVAYDDCRPMLMTPYKEGNDYINAVYVSSLRQANAFILTQLPLPWTLVDFWRLVIDHQVKTVILLDDVDGIDKDCPVYWPVDSSECMFGPFEVEVSTTQDSNCEAAVFKIREFFVRNTTMTQSEPWVIRQYHLLNWSNDSSVPDNPLILLELMNSVHNWQQQNAVPSPTVIQCIDGATKCGLYAAGCYVVDKMKMDQEVDVFLSCRYVTSQRPKAIDSTEQYKCLHELASVCMAQYDDYDNFRPMSH